jgi:hypothetical protein
MRRTLWSLAALALIALTVAGCSNAPAGTGTGSSGSNTTAATREQAMQFAACMRANGVKDFPDPDASGALTIDQIANGSSLDTSTTAFKQALSACKDLEPPGFTGGTRSPEQQKAALKFAQCMRDNGVKDFPDPTEDGPLIDTSRIPSAAGRGARNIPGFDAAIETCRDYLSGALGDQ